MGVTRLLPNAAAISEFVAQYHGDCGETAELVALHHLKGWDLNAVNLATIVKRDIAHGWAGSNGAEPLSSIANDLRTEGVVYDIYDYAEPFGADWHSVLLAQAGLVPIILQVAKGGNLPGDEKGVQYHFICVVGINPSGYDVADGDNPASNSGKLVIYSFTDLQNAAVCGMIVCHSATPSAAPVSVGTPSMRIPTGWTDDGSTLTAPNSQSVVQGFRTFLLNDPTWEADNWPLAHEFATDQVEYGASMGSGSRQDFRKCSLVWASQHPELGSNGVYKCWIGQDLLALKAERDTATAALNGASAATSAAQAQVADLQKELAAANAGSENLHQQLQDATAKLAAGTIVPPEQQEALTAGVALVSLLKTLTA